MTPRCSSHHIGFAHSRALVGTKSCSSDPVSDGALVGHVTPSQMGRWLAFLLSDSSLVFWIHL